MSLISRFTSISGDNVIRCEETSDADYARDCFDGSDGEWKEVIEESEDGRFYIVSAGLNGCFMADMVSVFGRKADAVSYAKSLKEEWDDQDDEVSE